MRKILPPLQKSILFARREQRAADKHKDTQSWLLSYTPYKGELPSLYMMQKNLSHLGWKIGDEVEHIEYPGIPLRVTGALTHTKPYTPTADELYEMHGPTTPYLYVTVRFEQSKSRLFNAGKLRKL